MTECFQDEDQRVPHNTTKERQRRELTDLMDDDFLIILRQSASRLPKYTGDACFASVIRSIWLSHGDELPDDLGQKYLARRAEVAWLEDHTTISGDFSGTGFRELARLVVEFNSRHRHLAGLSRKKARQ